MAVSPYRIESLRLCAETSESGAFRAVLQRCRGILIRIEYYKDATGMPAWGKCYFDRCIPENTGRNRRLKARGPGCCIPADYPGTETSKRTTCQALNWKCEETRQYPPPGISSSHYIRTLFRGMHHLAANFFDFMSDKYISF